MNVRAGFFTDSFVAFPAFPQWLGKYSSTNKRRRLISELVIHMNGRITGGAQAVRFDYVPTLREKFIGMFR